MDILMIKRNSAWSILLLLLLVSVLFPGPRHFIYENRLVVSVDSIAVDYVNAGLERATYAYALARSFNAAVSVVQGSQLQVEPGGVGVSLALGEVLDPVNDLIERFSWVMLVSLISLGIQKVLIEVSPWLSVAVLLGLAFVVFLAGIWLEKRLLFNFFNAGKTLLFIALIVRFAVPLMAYLNHQVYVGLLEAKHDRIVRSMETDIKSMKDDTPGNRTSTGNLEENGLDTAWFFNSTSSLARTVQQGMNLLDIRTRVETIKGIARGLFDKLITLIVVFVLNTIVLPIGFIWAMVMIGRLFLSSRFLLKQEKYLKQKIKQNSPG